MTWVDNILSCYYDWKSFVILIFLFESLRTGHIFRIDGGGFLQCTIILYILRILVILLYLFYSLFALFSVYFIWIYNSILGTRPLASYTSIQHKERMSNPSSLPICRTDCTLLVDRPRRYTVIAQHLSRLTKIFYNIIYGQKLHFEKSFTKMSDSFFYCRTEGPTTFL